MTLSLIIEKIMKRNNYISRDNYFMGIALLSAQRSKDPLTQVGACLVNDDNVIVGTGYNGLPHSCSDDEFPRDKHPTDFLENKHSYVVHAEVNAILNSNASTRGTTLYVGLFPCNECAKIIIQSKIKKVIYLQLKPGREDNTAAKRMFDAAQIPYEQYQATIDSLTLSFLPSS